MCGRFVVAKTVGEILNIFEADEVIGEVPGISYNVAPTQQIAIIVDRSFEKATTARRLVNSVVKFILLGGVWYHVGRKGPMKAHHLLMAASKAS